MSAPQEVQEAAQRLCAIIEANWARFALYRPPEGSRPARYCPYAAIALVTGGPVPDPDESAPRDYDRARPWMLADFVEVTKHCRTNPIARELVARFYANARRADDLPKSFDLTRPEQDLIGVWNAHNETNQRALEIARTVANRLT